MIWFLEQEMKAVGIWNIFENAATFTTTYVAVHVAGIKSDTLIVYLQLHHPCNIQFMYLASYHCLTPQQQR